MMEYLFFRGAWAHYKPSEAKGRGGWGAALRGLLRRARRRRWASSAALLRGSGSGPRPGLSETAGQGKAGL